MMEFLEMGNTDGRFTDADIARWDSRIMPFPLTEGYIPKGGAPLKDISDEILLNAPPHLIAHIQRTASQGGMQVISPRQTPVTALMTRGSRPERQLGDHIVGSVATPVVKWPTVFDDDTDEWLPDQPLCPEPADQGLRTRTITQPLTTAGSTISDPILKCLVKGRAVIDILRRDDVQGGADELIDLLCNAWGIGREEMDELDALTLGVSGPLLRHAIKTDDVFPMLHVPIQVKRSISVGVSEITRELLPEDTAMDWKRMRVFCEAVFAMACSIEGHVMSQITAVPPPGDPVARANREHTMCFLPSPGSAWYFGPETFSIMPVIRPSTLKNKGIPKEVYEALARYVEVARPVSHAIAAGHNATARRTTALPAHVPDRETISEGYRLMSRCMVVGSARGRTAAAAVRNSIYKTLENASMSIRMRLVRYLHIAAKECKIHLGDDLVPDSVIDKIANKFQIIGDMIRREVVAEAARRGSSATDWWADILSQAPSRYAAFVEGTVGWTRVALWLLFRGPTDRWDKLVSAVHFSALRDAERSAVESMSLPPTYGSPERIVEIGRKVTKRITMAYSGYYMGVADVGNAIAAELDVRNRPRSAATLREASLMWFTRSVSLRGANVRAIAKDEEKKSELHTRITFPGIDLILAPAPYRAFETYKAHVEDSAILPRVFKMHMKEDHGPARSQVFSKYTRPLLPCAESVVTRYLLRPWELGSAMERGWQELVEDIRVAVGLFGLRREVVSQPAPVEEGGCGLYIEPWKSNAKGYYETYGQMTDDEVDWADNIVDFLDPLDSERLFSMEFRDVNHLREVLTSLAGDSEITIQTFRETVL